MRRSVPRGPANTKQEALFRDAPVWRAIATMAIPSMVSMLVMILYNMADMFFIARLGDTAQVAAVSLVGPIFTVLMAVGSMLGGGGSALIAKTLGRQDGEAAKLYSSLACWGSVAFGIAFAALLLLGRSPVLSFLGAITEIRPYAQTYLSVLALGAPIMIFSTAFGNIVRAEGAVKQSMVGHLLATLINILLDPLFILVFRMGVAGAAIATVIGNAAGAAYLIHYVVRRSGSFTLAPSYAVKDPLAIRKILAIGLPNFVNSTLVGFSHALANQLLVQYGTIAVAGMAAAGKSTSMISMAQMGITIGVQPLLAYNYGAKNLPRIRETLSKVCVLTISIGLALLLFCSLNGRLVVSLFLKEPAALAVGQKMVRYLVITGPFLGLYYIGSSFLQASGNAKLATLVSLLRQGIFLIPMLYLMNHYFGMMGNIAGHIVADIAAAAVAIALALYQYNLLKREMDRASNFLPAEQASLPQSHGKQP